MGGFVCHVRFCCDRYLFELAGRDHKTLKEWMTGFEATGELTIKGAY
jgi:hypothetical protein